MNPIACVITIVGSLVTPCPQAERPSPTEAVAVLTASIPPFVYVDRGEGPQAFILPYSGPYDPPQAQIQPLAAPWSSAWYDGRFGYGGVYGGPYGGYVRGAGRYRPIPFPPADRRMVPASAAERHPREASATPAHSGPVGGAAGARQIRRFR